MVLSVLCNQIMHVYILYYIQISVMSQRTKSETSKITIISVPHTNLPLHTRVILYETLLIHIPTFLRVNCRVFEK